MRPFHVVAPGGALAGGASALSARIAPLAAAPVKSDALFRAANPMVDGSNLRFNLRQAGSVQMDVPSVAGRRGVAGVGMVRSRQSRGRLERPPSSGETLANGVYVVRFRGDGTETASKRWCWSADRLISSGRASRRGPFSPR